ncbi:unnamed protein product [Spodoptera exigua]|nr:unnamed protein product [Spodoptera exigua]
MSIAQKLCDEIVQPALGTSPKIFTTPKKCLFPSSASNKYYNITQSGSGSGSRSITRKRQPSNITLQRKGIVTKSSLRSKDFGASNYKKVLVDTAINTKATGPLKCDHNCVTDVRRRDNHSCGCKCSQRRLPNCKSSVKQVQTFDTKNYLLADKACSQTVKTLSCGTQFLDRLSHASKRETRNEKMHNSKYTMKEFKARQSRNAKHMEESTIALDERTHNVLNSARRWALNNFPVHGPDF